MDSSFCAAFTSVSIERLSESLIPASTTSRGRGKFYESTRKGKTEYRTWRWVPHSIKVFWYLRECSKGKPIRIFSHKPKAHGHFFYSRLTQVYGRIRMKLWTIWHKEKRYWKNIDSEGNSWSHHKYTLNCNFQPEKSIHIQSIWFAERFHFLRSST